jgi:hypothetical protein
MPHPVANARMYSAMPSLKADWKLLLQWVLARADLAWDVIDYDAPAPLSALWQRAQGARLYRAAAGNLIHARGVIDALAAGRIDVGPLDSYYHDLLRKNEPGFAAQVRTVAATRPLPIPPLVATAAIAPSELARLRQALQGAASEPPLAPVMDRLLLAGFALPDPADYQPLAAMASASHLSFEDL